MLKNRKKTNRKKKHIHVKNLSAFFSYFFLSSPLPAGYCYCVQIRLAGCIFSGLCIETVSLAVYIIRERLWQGHCQRPRPTDISCVLVCELAMVVLPWPLHNLCVTATVCVRLCVCTGPQVMFEVQGCQC